MPIRHFDIFTAERRLIQTSAVSQLKDTRLGIEGNYWLRKVLAKEPAVTAMGGTPLGLRQSIEKELEYYKTHHIQPVFVFPGLSILRKSKPFSTEDTRPGHRAAGWDFYDKGKPDMALANWGSSGGVPPADLMNLVCHILHEHDIDFVRAPYSAWAQLAYMYTHPKSMINAVYGGSELLMWDIDKIITVIDTEKGNYHWVSKKTVIQDLRVSDEQFLDICILAGFEYCPSFPPLNTTVMSFTFKGVHDLIRQHKTGFNAVQAYADDPTLSKINYVDTFCRTRCAVKYHLVMTDEGEVKPLNIDNSPSDIHEFIGYRLPDEFYYYLFRGLIGPQSINNLVSGALIENAPLDNGETTEYRNFLIQLLNIRTQTLSLLTQPLHQFYQTRKVATHFWFEPHVEHIMYHQPSQGGSPNQINETPLNTVYKKTSSWNVTNDVLETEKKTQNVSTVDFAFCIRATEDEARAAKTITQPHPDQPLVEKDEIVANVLWKTLEIRDFLTSSKHIYTPWGRALAVAFNKSGPLLSDSFLHTQEALLAAFELIRFEVLTANPYSKTYSQPVGDDKQQKHITLITRTLSLLPMHLKSTSWSGPLNRDLLVFNSFVKALSRSYRNLCEMLTLSFFLNGLVKKERNDYFEIADNLPFMTDINVALGLVVKHYLEQTLDNGVDAMDSTEKTFPSCTEIKADMQKGFQFWDSVMAGVKTLKEAKSISEVTYTMFVEADNWLQPKKP